MFSVIKTWKIWFTLSGALIAASIILLFVWGLRPGIDLRGGSLSELEFGAPQNVGDMRQYLTAAGLRNVVVQPVNDTTLIIKTEPLAGQGLEEFNTAIKEKFGDFKELRFESIGPAISKELVRKAYWQIGLVVVGILLYIAYAFRKVSETARKSKLSSWRLGLAAIAALIHDLFITMGVFVVLGRYRGVEIDTLFITALLTILGFSVHDTIVVFDRIRETLRERQHDPLDSVIDSSINSTLARSINTSSTLIFVLIAMLLFGGQTIFNFVLALLVGVVTGTYSSIFIASPILFLWVRNKNRTKI
ncbi:MAG: protein translocase subunit SecF [Candidatus Doudnabacteria bacterium]|nr:protein translocase subunit SecF [Candidatus Doudnabacteria bacterium]